MKTIKMSNHQTCRTFQSAEEACVYIHKFVPDVAFPEVVKIALSGSSPQFGIMMCKKLGHKEKSLFELRNIEGK